MIIFCAQFSTCVNLPVTLLLKLLILGNRSENLLKGPGVTWNRALIWIAVGMWLVWIVGAVSTRPFVARTGGSSATSVGGRILEWEWIDVGQSALTLEGNVGCCTTRTLTDQNAARMVPGLGVSIVSAWLRDSWWAALVLTGAAWLVVTWLVALLVQAASHSEGTSLRGALGAMTSCALAMTSPGFLAFVGNIDAHQFGYLGAMVGISVVTKPFGLAAAPIPDSRTLVPVVSPPVLVALGLFVCDGTLQLGMPLLALLWVVAVGETVAGGLRGARASGRYLTMTTSVYLVLQLGWALVSRAAGPGFLLPHNEASTYIRSLLDVGLVPTAFELSGRIQVAGQAIIDVFGSALLGIAALGWVVVPWRVKVWSGTWVALIVGATLVTRLAPRTIYLVFPSVYVLAGVAVAWSLEVVRRILGSGWWRERVAAVAVGGATAWLLVPTLLLRLGFLWGDLRVSALWWPYQP